MEKFEGWVYYVGEEYITIEVSVKDKPDNHVEKRNIKRYIVMLSVLNWNWDELKYVMNRRDDDILNQYKSQTDRYLDP